MPISPIDPASLGLRELGVRGGESSPAEAIEVDATSATRKFRCLWSKRFAAVAFFVGECDVQAGVLVRSLPQAHPSLPSLYATKVTRIQGFNWASTFSSRDSNTGAITPLNIYVDADLDIYYEHVPYEVETDAAVIALAAGADPDPVEMYRYVENPSAPPQGGGEALTFPGNALTLVDVASTKMGNAPTNVSIINSQETFHVTWHRVPEIAWGPGTPLYTRIYTGLTADAANHGGVKAPMFGTTNDVLFLGRPAGTVLFHGVTPHRRKSPTGDRYEWDLEYEFIYKPTMWNFLRNWVPGGVNDGWFFTTKNATYYAPNLLPDGVSLYNARDLRKLFQVA